MRDGVIRRADRIVRARARARCGKERAAESVGHRNVRRCRIGHQHRNEERRYLRPRAVLVGFVGVEPERDDAADAGADDAADLLFELGIVGKVRIFDRFARRDERELCETIHSARFLTTDQDLRFEVLDFTGDARIEKARIEGRDRSDARFAGNSDGSKTRRGYFQWG